MGSREAYLAGLSLIKKGITDGVGKSVVVEQGTQLERGGFDRGRYHHYGVRGKVVVNGEVVNADQLTLGEPCGNVWLRRGGVLIEFVPAELVTGFRIEEE